MIKEQVFIICLEDEQGHTVNFERFSYKKLSTCISKMVLLYKQMQTFSFIKEELDRTVYVVAYKPDATTNYCATEQNKILTIPVKEFLQMIA